MTLPEAGSLVLKAGGVGDGGMVYILDMGNPVRIKKLAEQMIKFYGLEPERDIQIEYIGLRPGERMTESLFSEDERPIETPYPRINRLIREPRFNGELKKVLACLNPVCSYDPGNASAYRNRRLLKSCLAEIIPGIESPDHEPEY